MERIYSGLITRAQEGFAGFPVASGKYNIEGKVSEELKNKGVESDLHRGLTPVIEYLLETFSESKFRITIESEE